MREMPVASIFAITVDRLCRIRSGTDADDIPFPVGDDGFLDPSTLQVSSADTLMPGALVDPRAAAEAGALELLGRHLKTLPARRHRSPAVEVDVSAASVVGEAGPMLTIVIDQLDDSPLIRHLAGRLRPLLAARETSQLRFLVACRTADYPASLTQVLRSTFGDCILADLAPLTRADAVRLAYSADHVDGESLIAAAVEAGASVLASVPLTLGLSVRTYRRTGALNARPTELFAQGVTQLIEEHDDSRRAVEEETSVAQRTAIAGRIAARLLLTGRRTIWRGSVLESREEDLNADTIEGGYETSANGSFLVTKKMVLTTLGTGLFTGRGENRLAFRHGSFAAYLTARYLIDRDIPRPQMERLFLVAGGDETRSIPTALREAAAWLVTLDPTHAQWLVEADPESLVGHSPIVDSPEMRAVIVEALLRRAPEIELGDHPWARSPRRLRHPGLDAQLLAVLTESEGAEPEDWPSWARVRLAVRLAREAGASQLAGPLLDLADNDTWSAVMRQLAARTAFETDPDRAVPRLARLLERFDDVEYSTRVDPDDEFRGSLLDMLWPDHISAEQLLPHLRKRRNRNLIGSYYMFERTFAARLPEDALAVILQLAKEQVRPAGPSQLTAAAGDPESQDEPPDERPVGGVDSEVIEGIVERALAGPTATDHVDDVATIVRPPLQRGDRPPLPATADVEDEDGREPPAATDLRRALAGSLVKLILGDGGFNRADAWHVIWGWGLGREPRPAGPPASAAGTRRAHRDGLLSTTDFMWLYEAASRAENDGDPSLASALAQVAALLFDLADIPSAELVYAHQDHPVWRYVSWWFEPVAVDSEQAQLMRQAYGSAPAAQTRPEPEADEFHARINELLHDVLAGNVDAFWRLAWNLQLDPSTGQGPRRFDDDLLDFPGVTVLEGDYAAALVDASIRFVTHEHDHGAEWLGTDRYDKRGWAGYLALALWEGQERLQDVPDAAWAGWVGALLWFPAMHGDNGERERKKKLFESAARHALAALAQAVVMYLRGQLAGGRMTSEVELIDPAWNRRLADTWVMMLDELSAAIARPVRISAAGSETPPGPDTRSEERR